MFDELRKAIESKLECTYADARYQVRDLLSISVSKGELEEVNSSQTTGVGIRVLKNGSWGFASVNSLGDKDLLETAKSAERIAELTSGARKNGSAGLAEVDLASGKFFAKVNGRLEDVTTEEKMNVVVEAEKRMRAKDARIVSARCAYNEIIDDRAEAVTHQHFDDPAIAPEVARPKPHHCWGSISLPGRHLVFFLLTSP